jgi:hypothetical protein
MKFKFSFLIALSAALVAGCAAYYSVFGLSQLFAGASLAVIIMASSLEFSKVVAVSFLHRYWDKISHGLRIYLSIGVFILICITSAGIYGFLSNAYQKTANKLEITEGQAGGLNNKKSLFEKNINDNNKIITTKSNRVEQLTQLRTAQEARLDAATTNSARSKARGDINSANGEIQKLNVEIDALNTKNASLSDSVNFYSGKLIELKTNDNATSEIGPLKYLAQLTGQPMDKVVNWFILLLIFVFDPLAVALVVATNRVIEIESGDTEPKPTKEPKPITDSKIKKHFGKLKDFFKKKDEPKIEPIKEIVNSVPEIIIPEQQIITPEPEIVTPVAYVEPKKEPVIPNGRIELNDIKEIKEKTNRGFSVNIPAPVTNTIQRIGSNKVIKDNDNSRVFFKKRR